MSTVQHPQRKAKQRPAAGPMRLWFQWLLALVYGPLVPAFQVRRTNKGRTGPSATRAWPRSRPKMTLSREPGQES